MDYCKHFVLQKSETVVNICMGVLVVCMEMQIFEHPDILETHNTESFWSKVCVAMTAGTSLEFNVKKKKKKVSP
jgi:hypothetical protein